MSFAENFTHYANLLSIKTSFLFQFRFAGKLDKFLLVIGSISSLIAGLAFPACVLIYGELATHFIYYRMLQDR